jgi:hypothetical protein
LWGVDTTESSTGAYTNAIAVNLVENTPVFTSGQILSVSSTGCYVVSRQESVLAYSGAYLNGVLRDSVSAYVNASSAYTDHIWLKTDDGSLSKKFLVLQQDYDGGTLEKAEQVHKTISGGIDRSIGQVYTTWSMIIRVKAEDSRENYGDLSDLEYLYGLNNPNGTPSDTIIFVDHRGYEYSVKMLGSMTKNLVTVEVEGEEALYLYRINLIKRV